MDPAQDKRAQRRKRQREYYAEKGKEVRRMTGEEKFGWLREAWGLFALCAQRIFLLA